MSWRRPHARGALLTAAGLVVGSLLVVGNPLTTAPAAAFFLLKIVRGPTVGERPHFRSEQGSILVEVLIGTLMLALTTAAVLNGLDGAQDIGRKNKDRSSAATLVQQDLERMRAMPPSVLANLNQTRTAVVGGVTYTIQSRTDLVRDASGLVSCTSDETDAQYFKLTSTVSSPASVNAPVSGTSLLTPPPGIFGDDKGTAAVKVTDRDGLPLEGVTIDLEGEDFYSAATNEVGCAIFAFIEEGEWTAEATGTYVNWAGISPATSDVTVAAEKTSLTELQVDVPASLRAHFVAPNGAAAQWKSISVGNSKLPNGYRAFPSATFATSKDATSLFPFYDGYGVFAGTCEANNPALWDADYFSTSGYGFAELDPGEALQDVNVQLPLVHVTMNRPGANFDRFRVYVEQTEDDYDDCDELFYDSGEVVIPQTQTHTVSTHVPFGHFRVCAAVRLGTSGSNGNWRRRMTGTSGQPAHADLTTSPLEKTTTFSMPTSGGSSSCTP
jgi:type II secretory pathway pseudopilin PulG